MQMMPGASSRQEDTQLTRISTINYMHISCAVIERMPTLSQSTLHGH